MRVISYNVNGIRAAIRKGFLEWLETDPADVICLQETKARKEDVNVEDIEALGYHTYWFSAEKKGYSGVAIFTKKKPTNVYYGNGFERSDSEGRVIRADFGTKTVISAYFPSGTSGSERQTYKYQWLDEFYGYINELRKERPNLIICGDYNICHREIDIHNPKGNKKNSGFLPEEREWMEKLFTTGYIDTFRHLNEEPHHYTWWSQRFPSVRLQNKGWRIDYISITDDMEKKLKSAAIYPDVKHSDHCPVFAEFKQ